jgi:hypothetical protein
MFYSEVHPNVFIGKALNPEIRTESGFDNASENLRKGCGACSVPDP